MKRGIYDDGPFAAILQGLVEERILGRPTHFPNCVSATRKDCSRRNPSTIDLDETATKMQLQKFLIALLSQNLCLKRSVDVSLPSERRFE